MRVRIPTFAAPDSDPDSSCRGDWFESARALDPGAAGTRRCVLRAPSTGGTTRRRKRTAAQEDSSGRERDFEVFFVVG